MHACIAPTYPQPSACTRRLQPAFRLTRSIRTSRSPRLVCKFCVVQARFTPAGTMRARMALMLCMLLIWHGRRLPLPALSFATASSADDTHSLAWCAHHRPNLLSNLKSLNFRPPILHVRARPCAVLLTSLSLHRQSGFDAVCAATVWGSDCGSLPPASLYCAAGYRRKTEIPPVLGRFHNLCCP